ncbi:N-acetyltransferase [Roseobacter denitrificans]|uniref:Acetyltransferase, putative n=1 Tax=Roseobacter denitrificans (strain ATCC 33942 / OCh 114) TaxID=375451 RepID=Q16BM3_ROSDO|nr:GNAT family N-acetyltransferase [Roseobacter denitrificans]ABG30620.1 acetyltransferase, putative [Roseobacter denitrificans OCh 114]AVL53756.1 N-acetyltransferase [Roseobacter denitrificans]SFG19327.1 Acetyltransferase (GNAT) family protein [Roseobacter denitrificans OCh 114]
MSLTRAQLFAAVDATWPAARYVETAHWVLRDGQGGGKRVSAATPRAGVSDPDIEAAEGAMKQLGQDALFMVRDADDTLDAALDARGYDLVDPVVILTSPVAALTDKPVPRLAAFTIWEPLAIMAEIWAKGGIGPARLEVMARAKVKTAILARNNQRPAGTAFVAAHGSVAMVHAVEVLPEHRRQGVAEWIMREAAFWAHAQQADTMAVLCTKENTAALALYSGLGFEAAAQYHYRYKTLTGDPRHG